MQTPICCKLSAQMGRSATREAPQTRVARSVRRGLISLHAYPVFATRPLPSTYQRSLAKGLPERRALLQSATSAQGVGPRVGDGAAPPERRAARYTATHLRACRGLYTRVVWLAGAH